MTTTPKPRLSLRAAIVWHAIIAYVREHARYMRKNRRALIQSASDVMDGWLEASDPEVIELRRKRIIRTVYVGDSGWNHGKTYDLAPRACALISGAPVVDMESGTPSTRN